MRVPSWLPTSALVGMFIYVLVYMALFVAWIVTGNDVWSLLMYVSIAVYLAISGLHIMYIRRRKRERS